MTAAEGAVGPPNRAPISRDAPDDRRIEVTVHAFCGLYVGAAQHSWGPAKCALYERRGGLQVAAGDAPGSGSPAIAAAVQAARRFRRLGPLALVAEIPTATPARRRLPRVNAKRPGGSLELHTGPGTRRNELHMRISHATATDSRSAMRAFAVRSSLLVLNHKEGHTMASSHSSIDQDVVLAAKLLDLVARAEVVA
jgi:hypothetical protein